MKKNKIFLMAEPCDNHFGIFSNAIQMAKNTKQARANIIKFQHHILDEETLKKFTKSSNFKVDLYSFLKKYSLPIENCFKIKNI